MWEMLEQKFIYLTIVVVASTILFAFIVGNYAIKNDKNIVKIDANNRKKNHVLNIQKLQTSKL